MDSKDIIRVAIATVAALLVGDFLEPKLREWLKIGADDAMKLKAARYGAAAAGGVGGYWVATMVIK